MGSKIKKLLSLLMVVCMIASMLPTTVFATLEDGTMSDEEKQAYYANLKQQYLDAGYTEYTVDGSSGKTWNSILRTKSGTVGTKAKPVKMYVNLKLSSHNGNQANIGKSGNSASQYTSVVVDLNGGTITREASARMFSIYKGAELTVINGTIEVDYLPKTEEDGTLTTGASGVVFWNNGAGDLTLDGVTIRVGTNVIKGGNGGIIYSSEGDSKITIKNSRLISSAQTMTGGAITSEGSIEIIDSEIDCSKAVVERNGTSGGFGGAIYAMKSLTIEGNSVIKGGTAYYGGAIATAGEVVINGGTIESLETTNVIRGACFYIANKGSVIMNSGAITNKNSSTMSGKIAYIATTGTFKMYGGTITDQTNDVQSFRLDSSSEDNDYSKNVRIYNGTVDTKVEIGSMVYRGTAVADCACYTKAADGTYTIWQHSLNDENYCSACEHKYTNAKTGTHTWDKGEVQTPATCTEKGVTLYTCTICGSTKTETIDVIPHSYNEEITQAPTCTVDGVKTFTCGCGDTYTETIKATGHTEVTDEAQAPTCTEDGLTAGKHCSVCGTVIVKQEIDPATGHNDTKGTVPGAAANCHANGSKTYYVCSCDTAWFVNANEQVIEIADVAAWLTDLSENGGAIAKLDHTADEAGACATCTYNAVETKPTCTAAGYTTYTCSCGHSYVVAGEAATGHSYDEGVVTKKATCEEDGVMTFTCVCGDSYTEAITKLNHNITYTDNGNRTHTKKCLNNCGIDVIEACADTDSDAKCDLCGAQLAEYVAKIGEQKFISVAAALQYARNEAMADVAIVLIGNTKANTTDSFDAYDNVVFNNVTFQQEDPSKAYYLYDLYTGDRTNGGKFTFDGVNLVVTDQAIFEGTVELINNSVITRTNDSKNFIYCSDLYIEPGSKFISQVDQLLGGHMTIDGGRTDGGFNQTPDYASVYLDSYAGDTLVAKNGAYILLSSGEAGQLNLNGTADLDAAKLVVYDKIVIDSTGCLNVDLNSFVSAKAITGSGVITIDATGFTGDAVVAIAANMSGFTGTIEVAGEGLTYEQTAEGLIIKEEIKNVSVTDAQGNISYYKTLQAAFEAAQDGDTITLLADIALETSASNGAFEIAGGRKLTLNLNGCNITAGAREGYTNRTQYAFDNYADLTITGEGTITARGIQNYGKLTIDSTDVTVIACDTNGGSCVWAYAGSETNISAGTYKTNGGEVAVITSYGTLNITGGTYTQAAGDAATYAIIVSDGTATISGATVTGIHGAVAAGATANVTIESGNYTVIGVAGQTDHCVYAAEGGVLTVKGGNFVGEATPDAGGQVVYGAGATIYGGTFSANETDNCAEGYKTVDADGNGVYEIKVMLPEAVISDIKDQLPEAAYDLTFALNFKIDGSNMSEQYINDLFATYGQYYVDFILTVNKDVTFQADSFIEPGEGNNYLAGEYGEYGWVAVPTTPITVKAGEPIYIMETASKIYNSNGLRFTLAEVAALVMDFDCGVYFTPEFMSQNPGLEISLELEVFNADRSEVISVAKDTFEAPAVAVVAEGEQTQYFNSLADAIAAAQDGDTIILLSDVELETSASNGAFEIAAGRELTLDLNGFNITAGARTGYTNRTQYAFDNYADLTITGEGTITSRGIQNYGTLTIDSADVTMIACDTNGGACVWAYAGSETNISAGTYKTNGGEAAVITSYGTLNITGGTYTQAAGNSATYAILANDGTATISGATVTGIHGAVYAGATANVTIESGNYTVIGVVGQSDHCVYAAAGGVLTVKGGNFVGEVTPDAGGQVVYGAGATIYGGTFSANETDNCAEGNHTVLVNGVYVYGAHSYTTQVIKPELNVQGYTKYTCTCGHTYNDNFVDALKGVASINGYGYATLAEALAAAQDNDVVELHESVVAKLAAGKNYCYQIDKAITLDGNGNTISFNGAYNSRVINISGADGVTIEDLVIETTGERGINIIGGATNVTIDGVTATAANYTINAASSAANAVIDIKDSNLTGKNVINVGAPGAQITVDKTTVNCNDETTEKFKAVTLNKDAVGAEMALTDCTINVTGDSYAASADAVDSVITIDGSTEGVMQAVAYIDRANNYFNTYYTLEGAVANAQAGDTIVLIRDASATFAQIPADVVLDFNGNTVTGTVLGTIRTNGGLLVTAQNIAMFGVGGRYNTTDATLYMDATGVIEIVKGEVTITRTEEWTDIGQTLIIGEEAKFIVPAGHTMQVRSSIIVNGEVDVDGTVNLHNADATITAPAGMNVTTTAGDVVLHDGTKYYVHDHSYTTEVIAPTFDAEGYTLHTCACGHTYKDNYTAKLEVIATIGDTRYNSLQQAINEAGAGDVITMKQNVVVEDTIVISADKTIVLDLAGCTISQVKNQTAAYEMILNKGNLTVKDSIGGGLISYTDSGNGGEYVSNTITNRGTITLESGTIENGSAAIVGLNGYPYVIDNDASGAATEAVVNVEGGVLNSVGYSAIRLRANSATKNSQVNISGGEIFGTIEVQKWGADKNLGELNITGGKISNSATANVLFVFGSNGDGSALDINISGGELNGNLTIKDSVGSGFNKAIIPGDSAATFNTDVTALCEAGYEAVYNDQTGRYGIDLMDGIVARNEQTGEVYSTVAEALDEAKKTETVIMLADSDEEEIYVRAGRILDLNGKTLKAVDVSCAFATSHIIDTVGGGLLVVDQQNIALNGANSYLPVWTAEGCSFVKVAFKQNLQLKTSADGDYAYFRFYINDAVTPADSALATALLDGGADNGIQIQVKLTWTMDGNTVNHYYVFSDELVEEYASNWINNEFRLKVFGVENISKLSATAIIVSEANSEATVEFDGETQTIIVNP